MFWKSKKKCIYLNHVFFNIKKINKKYNFFTIVLNNLGTIMNNIMIIVIIRASDF